MKEHETVTGKVWTGADIRITVITERLIRAEKKNLTDERTQTVWNREFDPEAKGTFEVCSGYILVKTDMIQVKVGNNGRFLSAMTPEGNVVTDFHDGNLMGTMRTLDEADGEVKLGEGIISKSGAAILDDSESLILEGENLGERKPCSDRYLFCYGDDYTAALQDFYHLTGPVPLIPRYALGNWWSRYRAYTQEEYQELIDTFVRKQIPLTVAVIDMDWHWTDVVERFGRKARPKNAVTARQRFEAHYMPGWTGYSWNTELFPDHCALLDRLHNQDLKVTLNVHPAAGLRFYEDAYPEAAAALGMKPEKKQPVPFDLSTKAKRDVYFEKIHRPLEDEGVDFWWIDWQQGTKTKHSDSDPLWQLNHYHTEDMKKRGIRPMILSRYAGPGSHRYPLGFSGDTIMTWKSLAFQPYFTSTASNIGYTWWSHDIGGHMNGYTDEQLYIRWVQFGVFSPINRLHSTACEYMGKEPWKHPRETERIVTDYLRLRHRMIPYLYSCNYQTATEGTPICEPLYYRYDDEEAYNYDNEYLFGPALIAAPITEPLDRDIQMAKVSAWLPEGHWTDIMNGRIYEAGEGGEKIDFYRELDQIPVLARAGAIIPVYAEGTTNSLDMAQEHELWIYRGNGEFRWYEDDGETESYRKGEYVITNISVQEEENGLIVRIAPEDGSDLSVVPETRKITLRFRDLSAGKAVILDQERTLRRIVKDNGQIETVVTIAYRNQPMEIRIVDAQVMENLPLAEEACRAVTMYQCDNGIKNKSSKGKSWAHYDEPGSFPAKLDKEIDELRSLWRK